MSKLCPKLSSLAVKGKAQQSNCHFKPSHDASKTKNKMKLGLSVHYIIIIINMIDYLSLLAPCVITQSH